MEFHQDVVALKPKVVVILAGTNDIAGNTGPATLEMIENNIAAMAEIAKANGIRVVMASVLPVYTYSWRPEIQNPADTIIALNKWMKDYAQAHGEVYLDLHSAMKDERNGMRKEITTDGVHVNEAGYRVMAPLTVAAIEQALESRPGLSLPHDSASGGAFAPSDFHRQHDQVVVARRDRLQRQSFHDRNSLAE